nr:MULTISPECIES: AlpA family transcriptional regulator [unclassified Chromohalobacter]
MSNQVLIKLKSVMQKTGLSRSSVYNKLDPKSPYYDPEFPRQVKLGRVSVAWVESEVDTWIDSIIENRK